MKRKIQGSVETVRLSRSERALGRLILEGLSTIEIAGRRGVAEGTVRNAVYLLSQGLRLTGGMRGIERWLLKHPEAVEGIPVELGTHPDGCGCGGPVCSVLERLRTA